ncbi:Diacylglycerol O-acyltransferase 3 [Linum grandiflorum]
MATAQSMIASYGGSTAIRLADGVNSRARDRTVRGVRFGARKWKVGALRREEFADSQHTQYYVSPRAGCGEEKEKKKARKEKNKKKLKLLKRLSTDLQMFVSGREEEDGGGMILSEAQKLLLAELEKLRSEEMEEKKKKKKMEEIALMQSSESSSSSSSESSDSDCGSNVMVMKSQRKRSNYVSIPQESSSVATLPAIEVQAEEVRDSAVSLVGCGSNSLTTAAPELSKRKIEVCMGGKCKKAGAMAVMEDFERKVGEEAMVVTCKCMGKCKTAPNVKVSSEDDGLLCIGVGLEDVDAIVAEMMGSSSHHYLPAMAP